MKAYKKPTMRVLRLQPEGLIALSKHDEQGGDQLTRGRRQSADGFGSGLWDESGE